MSDIIFMDHVNTTPCDPRVVEAMLPYFTEKFGNPSSHIQQIGAEAIQTVDEAREPIRKLLGADGYRVVFTSGATEANNLAILGMMARSEKKHVLLSEVEHFSIFNLQHFLRDHGFEVELIPVDEDGRVWPNQLKAMLRDDTAFVSVLHANGEIGTANSIKDLAAVAKEAGALFHSDCTVSAGLFPIKMCDWKLDAVTISAHNFYGPKGVGALVLAPDVKLRSRSYGGWQEDGLRSGTENVPGIVGMAKAAELATIEGPERRERIFKLGKALMERMAREVPFLNITGHYDASQRLPGHVSFWVEHVEGESLILFLNVKGIMAASGSACSSNLKAKDEEDLVSSHVLAAVGVPTDICAGSVTLSLGKDSTEEHVDRVVTELVPIVERLLSMSPSYADYKKKQEG